MNLIEFRIAIDLLGFKPSKTHSSIFRIIISPQISFTIYISNSEIFGLDIKNQGIGYSQPEEALKSIVKRIKVEKARAERVNEVMSHLP